MAMDGSRPIYVPILKWKLGEQSAVKPLTDAQKRVIFPIAEVQDRPYDWKNSRYAKSWDKHLVDVAKATAKHWGTVHEIAVDQPMVAGDALSDHAGTSWEYFFSQLWGQGVNAVPVASSRAKLPEVEALMRVAAANKRTRWVLRYVLDSGAKIPSASDLENWFAAALTVLKADHAQVDAVLDLAHVATWEVKAQALTVAAWIVAIAALGPWRNVVLASGAFPQNLAGIPKGTKQLERKDWALLLEVRQQPVLRGVRLVYGDYGISHVDAFDEDPRMLKMSANLRYAHWTHWHVIKGSSVKDFGFDQYKDLCKVLTALPIFLEAKFSQGDANYYDIANNPTATSGNATIWRRDSTNHHLHVVLHQLATLPAT